MVAVESSKRRNKILYKLELCTLKVMPMVLAVLFAVHTILTYFAIECPILTFIGGTSFIPLLFMYLSSYVFKFCAYYRMFLHYIALSNIINIYDYYVGIPISDFNLLSLHMALLGVSLFISLYLYVTTNKKDASKDSG